jgi:hypothetical protein
MVHIMQLKCEQNHSYIAIAWDDTNTTQKQAESQLTSLWLTSAGLRVPPHKCAVCGSQYFHAEDGVTRFETMEEAQPHLENSDRVQLLTQTMLTREV